VLCVHSLNAFMPIIIKNMLAGTAAAGSTSTGGNSALNTRNAMLLSAIPYTMAAIAMSVTAWHSDRVRERTLHIGVTAMVGSVFWLCFGPMYNRSLAAGFVSLVFTLALAYAQMGVMYARVTGVLCLAGSGLSLRVELQSVQECVTVARQRQPLHYVQASEMCVCKMPCTHAPSSAL